MFFYLRGKQWTLPVDTTEEEKTQKLFTAIQGLPNAEENIAEVEKLEKKLEQQSARGVMEKGYIVVTDNSFDDIYIGGTDMLDSCIGISFYDPSSHKVAIAHIDLSINIGMLATIIAEFKDSKYLEVRLFGGTYELGNSNTDDYQHSLEIAKKIYSYLYYQATQFVDIDIRSSNTFEKLKVFKEHLLSTTDDLTIGFAINSRTGKPLVFHHEHFGQWLPYTKVNNCGIFKGATKRGAIGIKLRRYLEIPPEKLVKYYDGAKPKYEKKLYETWEKNSAQGIVTILISKLRDLKLATNIPGMDNELVTFITSSLDQWQQQYGNKNSYLEILLKHTVIEIYQNKIKELELHPYSPEEIDNFFINQLLQSGIIQQQCYQQVRTDIAKIVVQQNSFNIKINDIVAKLQLINSDSHLMEELVDYKIIYNNITNGDVISKTYSSNLLVKLTQLKDKYPDVLDHIIREWIDEKIEHMIKAHISAKVMQNIHQIYYKRLTDGEEAFFYRWVSEKLSEHKSSLLPHLHFNADHSTALNSMTSQMASEIANNISCFPCFSKALTSNVLTHLSEKIDDWLITINIKENEKEEEEELYSFSN